MIDLWNETQRGRLLKAIKTSLEGLEPFRRTRTELIRDYVGSWYSGRGARFETLVNLINQTARIYARVLAANNPRVNITSSRPDLWPFASRYETAINRMIVSMDLDQTFRSIVLDAFFSIGVAKVCMADSAEVEAEQDVWFDPGKPWVGRVSVDDMILDMSAKELSKMRFAGDRYRASWKKIQEEPTFDQKVIEKLAPTSKDSHDLGSELARDIGSGRAVDDDELEPMLWLMEVWIPENRSVATFACDQDLPPLVEREWPGGQGGPYKYLSLGLVPDNVMPSSPAANLKGLHDLINKTYRKMASQCSQQKSIVTYPPGEEDEANRGRKAKNGDWIMMRDPKSIATVNFGGVDGNSAAFAMALNDKFDRMAGNLMAMGGLGAQTETVGQEQIIQGNVSSQSADLQFQVVQFATEVCYELGYLIWADNLLYIPATMEVPGTKTQIQADWTPENRQGEFDEYDFRVQPYSMIYQTPPQKVQKISQVLQQIAPLWPMFQASGATLDVQQLVNIFSEYMDLPELRQIVTFITQPGMGESGESNTTRQSPVTSRETVRRNVPTGGTADSRSAILQQVMMGGGQTTPGQRASLTRASA